MFNIISSGALQNSNISFSGANKDSFRLYDASNGSYIDVKRSDTVKHDTFEPQGTQSNVQKSGKNTTQGRAKNTQLKRKNKRKNSLKRNIAVGLATFAAATSMGVYSLTSKPPETEPIGVIVSETPSEESVNPEYDMINSANKALSENPQLKDASDKINDALDTFSIQMGEDGLSLIKERINLLGDGEIDVIDVLKILWIESRGKVYDDEGDYLVSYTGEAFGPFQLTPDTVDYLNNYYGLEEPLDVMNPYDNLDACILNLKFLKDKKLADSAEAPLPTGENIMDAVFWCYHDGAWADDITKQGEDYLAKYRDLSIVDSYPEVVEYITNGLC